MTRYDIWKTASPPEYDLECCEECFVTSHDVPTEFGERAVPEGCGDEDCFCHSTDDGDAGFDAMRDDQLTEAI